jgi:UDPglucose 6-dehydrogenase
MKVAVLGLWHLGSVTAACIAEAGHSVTGFDPDARTVANLSAGQPPIAEPGLPELVTRGLAAGRLRFTADVADAVRDAEIVWICFDTPVDEEDRADVDHVVRQAETTFPWLADDAIVLSSSQLPVGSVRRLEAASAKPSRSSPGPTASLRGSGTRGRGTGSPRSSPRSPIGSSGCRWNRRR